jgi:protease-4
MDVIVICSKYSKSNPKPKKEFTSDKIAVIYAIGEIEGGQGDDETIGSDKISETIREARLDKNIKAIVLRVNSPGGSALASDVIWREVVLAKKVKPVVVSMGNVAASGGYYISCAANAIVAEPTTITGSIGVFGLMFNAQNMFKNKLGLTFDTYKTSNYTDLGTVTRPLTNGEKNILQVQVDQVYNTFTSRVAQGRKMSQADVDSIGQGRVWSGIDAKRIGLVDESTESKPTGFWLP